MSNKPPTIFNLIIVRGLLGNCFFLGERRMQRKAMADFEKLITQIQFIQLILWVNIFGEVGIANVYIIFYHISSSHNANTHIRAVFQRAATIVKSWYWSWSVGKPCQISNQHHCYHHHRPCQPTLSSPKSFQYKTYIFYFADILTPEPTNCYRWLSN